MNKNFFRRSSLEAIVLVMASLAIAVLPMTARVAKGVDAIANWPDLKALLHSRADSKVVTLSRGTSLVLDASNAVLAPDLELLQVDNVTDPTVVVPANGVLTFAVEVTEPVYVAGAVSLAADPADLRPGLRAYVLSDNTVVAAPMIYADLLPGQTQVDFGRPGKMPAKKAPLRTWRLEPGRHYISIAGPPARIKRNAGTFEGIELLGLETVPETPVYTFAQFSDPQYIVEYPIATQLGKTFNALRQEGVSFAVIAGDMTENALTEQHKMLSEAISAGGGLPVYGCIGNHDSYYTTSRPELLAIPGLFPTGATNYTFTQGPLRFVVTDGSYWQTEEGKWVDYYFTSRFTKSEEMVAIGMSPEGLQWLSETLAADTTNPTIVVCHYRFSFSPGKTQCGYVLDKHAQQGDLQDIIKAAPNVFATLNGHNHWNHVETYQNDYGDDITSHTGPPFGIWPGGYKIFRVYSDGDDVRLEWEMRLVDNMGYRHFGTRDGGISSLSLSWGISTSYGRDLISEPGGR